MRGPATGRVGLREVREADLPAFFAHVSDPEAKWMAAFSNDPTDSKAFVDRWHKMLVDPKCRAWTVLLDERVVGNIVLFELLGNPSVGYWYSRDVWGRGVATHALRQFLGLVPARPLFARVAADNVASIRVLEKCGFTQAGQDKGYAAGREAVTEERIYRRDAP